MTAPTWYDGELFGYRELEDDAGDALPERATLQVKAPLAVADDKANARTVLSAPDVLARESGQVSVFGGAAEDLIFDSFRATLNNGVTDNVFTYTVNTSVEQEISVMVRAHARAGSETAGYMRVATFEVAGGVLAQVGTTGILHNAENDAAWDLTVDASGADIRVRGTADSASSTEFKGTVEIMVTT